MSGYVVGWTTHNDKDDNGGMIYLTLKTSDQTRGMGSRDRFKLGR